MYRDDYGEDSIIDSKDISTDSFLVFGFDKISGDSFNNNDERISPYVFENIFDAILYLYHKHFSFEYGVRLEGFFYCQSNTKYEGSHDELQEKYILSEQRLALQDLMELILTDGYELEHSELLTRNIRISGCSIGSTWPNGPRPAMFDWPISMKMFKSHAATFFSTVTEDSVDHASGK